MVHGILFWSLIFLKLPVSVPVPVWKALSNYGFDGHMFMDILEVNI